MGYLVDSGNTLTFDELKNHIPKIREDAIFQLLHLIKKFKHIESTEHLWGDEIEYHIIRVDPVLKRTQICLNQIETIKRIKSDHFDAQEEFGGWMIEAVPKNPYSVNIDPKDILKGYQLQRTGIQEYLPPGQFVFASPIFPMLGVGDFYFKKDEIQDPKTPSIISDDLESPSQKSEILEESKSTLPSKESVEEENPVTLSRLISDETLGNHPRYATIAENVRNRRGEKACIFLPIFKDEFTSFKASKDEPEPGFIYMDAMQFGAGNCCI